MALDLHKNRCQCVKCESSINHSSIDHDLEIKALKNQMKHTVHFIFFFLVVVSKESGEQESTAADVLECVKMKKRNVDL